MLRRVHEIENIRQEYHWLYPLITGAVLVIVGVIIGAWLFGSDSPVLSGNMLAYSTNLWTEAVSIGITVFILEQINRHRDRLANKAKEQMQKAEAIKELKQRLILELGSPDNATALNALDKIIANGWIYDGTLIHANLEGAVLQNTELMLANLQKTQFYKANLDGAKLTLADLREAKLIKANLQNTQLTMTQLQGANLFLANLRGGRDIEKALFDEKTVLPDAKQLRDENGNIVYNKYWTPETDMRRYTDPNRPDFWYWRNLIKPKKVSKTTYND